MNKLNKKYITLIAIGILSMSVGTFINFYYPIDIDILDFFKGLGFSIVISSFYFLIKNKKISRSDNS